MGSGRRLGISLLALLAVIVLGLLGYSLLEGLPLLDALYMTIITVSTVGFREVAELTPQGRVFTIMLILFGVGAAFIAFVNAAQWVVEGELAQFLGRRKVEKRIEALKDHYILCGFGRVGRTIARELDRERVPLVVIEKEEETIEQHRWEGLLVLAGDATREEVLIRAGLERAKGVITALPSDADNLLLVLTARELNPRLYLVARGGEEEGSDRRLRRAGADKVVSPHHLGGLRMAHAVLRPSVVDFVEIATQNESLELEMEEIEIREGSSLSRTSLKDSGIRQEHGIIVVAVKKATGSMIYNPSPETMLEPGDRLIALGRPEEVERLERRISP